MNLTDTRDPQIIFEVYDKRALHEPITGLVKLDYDTSIRKAERSATRWGGVVVKVTAIVRQRWPIAREVIATEVVWVHSPLPAKRDPTGGLGLKQLKSKLQKYDRKPFAYKKKGKR